MIYTSVICWVNTN